MIVLIFVNARSEAKPQSRALRANALACFTAFAVTKWMGKLTSCPAPVTLNSFQGPSLGLRRSAVQGANRAAVPTALASGHAAQLMLKQVQHDGVVGKVER